MALAPALPRQATHRAWVWLFVPALADILIGMALLRHYFLLPGGWGKLLADANIGLQIRAGDLIRAGGSSLAGALPVTDPFTFARPGERWFAWEWLFDVAASWWHEQFGLAGVAVAGLALIAGALTLSYLGAVRRNGGWVAPAALLLLGTGAASIHFLARPHLVSWIGLAVAVAVVERERRAPGRALWGLIPAGLFWANLHGGFLLLPVLLGLVAAGQFVEGRRWEARRFALAGAGALAASLVNPYGWELHRHILEFMRAGWVVQAVEEFRPPGPALGFAYWFIVALGCVSIYAGWRSVRQRQWTDLLLLAFFTVSAFRSARHVPLMVIALLPVWGGCVRPWLGRTLDGLERDMLPQFGRVSLAIPALLLAAFVWPDRFGVGRTFPAESFPVALVERQWERMQSRRVFTTDAWGDYLVYRAPVGWRVWVTGNNDYLGMEVGRRYLEVLEGRAGAGEVLREMGFAAALTPKGKAAERWFLGSAEWRLVESDGVASYFERVER